MSRFKASVGPFEQPSVTCQARTPAPGPGAQVLWQLRANFVKGADDLDVDGIFGPNTEAAVQDFQDNENLSVDGIVGKQTWATLLRHWLLISQPG